MSIKDKLAELGLTLPVAVTASEAIPAPAELTALTCTV